jgi:hypothetical protein
VRPEINPCISGQLIVSKGAMALQWERTEPSNHLFNKSSIQTNQLFNKSAVGTTGYSRAKERNPIIQYIKSNSK